MLIKHDGPIPLKTFEYPCNNKDVNYTNTHRRLAVKGETKCLLGRRKRPKQASDDASPALSQLPAIWEKRSPEPAVVSVYSISLNKVLS